MTKHVLFMGIDVGTTAVKVVAMTEKGEIVAKASVAYGTVSPRPGWVEQDPEVWWNAAVAAVRNCLEKTGDRRIEAVSFSGHMSATVLVGEDGLPVMPSILIADARSFEETRFLRETRKNRFVDMTGNEPLDAFAVSKLLWLKHHRPEKLRVAKIFLFPKDYIRYKFTGEFGSDPSDAGNSLLYDFLKGNWDDGLIKELGLNTALFPAIHPSHAEFAKITRDAAKLTGLPEGTKVVTGAADMACSQLGTGASQTATLAITLSTSAQVVMRVPSFQTKSTGRITFHPSAIPGTLYAMGTIFTCGLGIDWGYGLLTGKTKLREEDYVELGKLSEGMADIPPGSDGLLFFPFLTGSATPYFDSRDRASWLGLSTGQSTRLLMHSIMEGIAYNIRENVELFEADGHRIERIHLGGGGSRNAYWCQMISDVLGKNVTILTNRDASAIGAAILAGVGIGAYPSAEDAAKTLVRTGETYEFREDRHRLYRSIYSQYRKLYDSLNEYYQTINNDPN